MKNHKRRYILVTIFIVTALAGLATLLVMKDSQVREPYTLSVTSSGGITGAGDGTNLIINQEGIVTTGTGSYKRKFSPNELENLEKDIEASGLQTKSAQSFTGGTGCYDGFNYLFVYASKSTRHTLNFDDCSPNSDLPAPVRSLYNTISTVK